MFDDRADRYIKHHSGAAIENMLLKIMKITEGYFGRVNFIWNEKYLLTGNVRRDGSSNFPKENRWVTTFSGALAWRMNNEFFLKDKKLGGYRLNTDFGVRHYLDLGRAFGFAYGTKENGAFFSHMIVMYAAALYQRGFVRQGYEVLRSIYRMAADGQNSKIYPGIPEYFDSEGRGMYHYLTGSASWYLLTLVTQVLGIRGQWGDLLLAPKLVPEQFGKSGQISAEVCFAGKRLNVTYLNRSRKPYGQYRIESALLQGRSLPVVGGQTLLISREALTAIAGPTADWVSSAIRSAVSMDDIRLMASLKPDNGTAARDRAPDRSAAGCRPTPADSAPQ